MGFGLAAGVVEVAAASDTGATFAYLLVAGSAVAMTVVGIRRNRPPELLAWCLIAAGLFLFLAGDVYFSVSKLVWHTERPFPSGADVFFVASYPALVGGLVLLAHRWDPGHDRVVLIDATIIATTTALLLWVYVIAPTAIEADGAMLDRVLGAGYPFFDVLLVGVTVRLALGPGPRRASCYLLGVAMVSLVLADLLYAVHQLLPSGSLPVAEPADLGWMGFYLFVAAAALHPSMGVVAVASVSDKVPGRARLFLLAMVALVAPGVLAVEHARGDSGQTVVIIVATVVLFILVMARIDQLLVRLDEARRTADAANEAKALFLSTMSHELRTPMTAMIGMSELLGEVPPGPEQRAFTEVIIKSGQAMLAVVDDILDFSRIEAGMMTLEPQPFELGSCIESALDLVAADACAKGLELVYEIVGELPLRLVGDGGRLSQVLLNLLANAVKFTDHGEVVLTVDAAEGDPGGTGDRALRFAVRDTGVGIAADAVPDLFRSYSRALTARRYGGTGLGLAISQHLTMAMGGRIWVESAVGHGSTFSFTAVFRPAPPDGGGGSSYPDQATDLAHRRLLLVDGNATSRGILQRQATRWGMSVAAVASPGEATAILEHGAGFDAAIVSMAVGGGDGPVPGRHEWLPGAPRIPLVALVPIDRLGDPGLHGEPPSVVVAKPVKPSDLRAALAVAVTVDTDVGESLAVPVPYGTTDRPPTQAPQPSPRALRVLVADDNAVNRQVAVLLLERLGCSADVAGDGHEVLAALRRERYDVVLMDLAMSGMDGLEATRRIRSEVPAADQPRIIAFTATTALAERQRVLAAGMNDFLSKPIDIAALAEAIARCPQRRPPGATRRDPADDQPMT